MRRRIAVVITNRAPYGRLLPVIKALKDHPGIELQIILATSNILDSLIFVLRYGNFWYVLQRLVLHLYYQTVVLLKKRKLFSRADPIEHDLLASGLQVTVRVPLFIHQNNLEDMAKVIGVGLFALPEVFKSLKSEVVLVHADRFEMLAVAISAAMSNLLIAHTQGGDITGSIDESVRHAISKFAQIHFPTTEVSKRRLIRMGENPESVFMVGCPTIDYVKSLTLDITDDLYEHLAKGYGKVPDLSLPYVLVMQHPITTEHNAAGSDIVHTLSAVQQLGLQTIVIGPNIDAGRDAIGQEINKFIETHTLPSLLIHKSLRPEDFYRVLGHATVAIGNSSSFIREGSYLGTPCVLVGKRQGHRERGENVVEVNAYAQDIVEAAKKQIAHGRYSQDMLFGSGNASTQIANILAEYNPPIQKRFYETT
ncbi:MAG TPA: UDP-N-acetylglucosamine 2-epimerase [Patescibacteria group bacterium]|nr:UDP-N-acetylglucosamine 2-epimerase [Patescibacteria group bacterium]